MKVIEHSKLYEDETLTEKCPDCRCLFEVELEDIKLLAKPKKIFTDMWCCVKEEFKYYCECPDCGTEILIETSKAEKFKNIMERKRENNE